MSEELYNHAKRLVESKQRLVSGEDLEKGLTNLKVILSYMKANAINDDVTSTVALELKSLYNSLIAKHDNPEQYRLEIIEEMKEILPMENIQAVSAIVAMHYDAVKGFVVAGEQAQALEHAVAGLNILKNHADDAHPYTPAMLSEVENAVEKLIIKAQEHFASKEFHDVLNISTKIVDAMKYAFPQGHKNMGTYLAYQGIGHLYLGECQEALPPLTESKSLLSEDSEDAQKLQGMINHCEDKLALEKQNTLLKDQLKTAFQDIWAKCSDLGYKSFDDCKLDIMGGEALGE